MKLSAFFSTAISLLFIFTPSNGHTAEHSSHDHKEHLQHEAHEHGVARLTLAVDGKRLEIMLESPAANLVGFEHSATTAEDKQKLVETKAKLAMGQGLFRINPEAECSLTSSEVESALFKHEDHDGHDDHGKHGHHEEGEGHNDIDASWLFTCADPSALKKIKTHLFTSFPGGFEKVMVEWITANYASAKTIHQDEVIELK